MFVDMFFGLSFDSFGLSSAVLPFPSHQQSFFSQNFLDF